MKLKYIDDKYLENAKDYIPVGSYCRGCIFWDKDETKPAQRNGYCHYLKKGDWEINSEVVVVDLNTDEELSRETTADIPFSLLWDGCKECGINDYELWCPDCKHSTDFEDYKCRCIL